MLYDTRRFVFTVSLCAMLAVNPVLATAPGEEELVSTVHDVYTESTNTGTEGAPLNLSSGIAGVTYVNRMVNSAGNAAQRAEDHAAAAGASAIAAQSAADDAQTAADDAQSAADAATETLKSKLDKSQGTDNKDKVMVVGSDGNLTPGMVGASAIADRAIGSINIEAGGVHSYNIADGAVTSGAIAHGAVTRDKIDAYSDYYATGGVLMFGGAYSTGSMYWDQVHSGMIADGAVTMNKIDADISFSSYSGGVLMYSGSGMSWGRVDSDMIADGAVTMDKISADGEYGVGSGVLMFYSGYYSGQSGLYWSQVRSGMIADGAVTFGNIAAGAVTFGNIAADGYNGDYKHGTVLMYSGDSTSSSMYWGKINSDMIDNGAVTPAQTAGVVGTIPWGSADSTTYGQFWIE